MFLLHNDWPSRSSDSTSHDAIQGHSKSPVQQGAWLLNTTTMIPHQNEPAHSSGGIDNQSKPTAAPSGEGHKNYPPATKHGPQNSHHLTSF